MIINLLRSFILLLFLISASSYSQVVTYGSQGPGGSYDDLNCVDCVLGFNDLIASEFDDFFQSDSYEITLSSPANFCAGDSVILSTTDTGSEYQWYMGDAEIPEANSDSLTMFSSGDYHVTLKVDADSFALQKVTVTVHPLPVVTNEKLATGYGAGFNKELFISYI